MSSNGEMSPEAQAAAEAAAAAAFREFAIELWTLFGVGAAVTILRTYARIKAVGLKHLRLDDVFVWFGLVSLSFPKHVEESDDGSLTAVALS